MARTWVNPFDRRTVERRRQIRTDGVEERADAAILESGTREDDEPATLQRERSERALERRLVNLATGTERLEDVLVDLRTDLDHSPAHRLDLVTLARRKGDALLLASLIAIDDELTREDVGDGEVAVVGPRGQADRHRPDAEAFFDVAKARREVSPWLVDLVDECEAGDAVPGGLAEHGLGLALHAARCVEDEHGSVEDTERALDLDREVDVPGRVDELESMLGLGERTARRRMRDRAGRCLDRDPLLPLERVVVEVGVAVMDLTLRPDPSGEEEDAFGASGLTRVDMGHDAHVAKSSDVAWHGGIPPSSGIAGLVRVGGRASGTKHRGRLACCGAGLFTPRAAAVPLRSNAR